MLCLLLASLFPLVATPSPEQTAFEYFATVLVVGQYPRAKHLYLTGRSEAQAHVKGLFAPCFPDTGFRAFWAANEATDAPAVPIAYRAFSRFKRASAFNRGGTQVRLYRAVTGLGGTYVYLAVYKMHHFTDHYLVKISDAGEVEVCKQGEIW